MAQVVGASVSAVKSRLHRARSELRERLVRQPSRRSATCPDIRLVFSKHLEGELSASMCTTLQAHIEDCPDCAAECDGSRQRSTRRCGAARGPPRRSATRQSRTTSGACGNADPLAQRTLVNGGSNRERAAIFFHRLYEDAP